MKSIASWIGIAVIATTVAAGVTVHATNTGRPAPDVSLSLPDGSTFRLADLRGTVVLVDFWASWCVPCRASFPALDSLQHQYHDRGFEVVALNVDENRKDADDFLRTRAHSMKVLFDPKGRAPEAFGVKGMPTSVLIDRKGVIRYVHEGYTEKTLDAYRSEISTLLQEK